MSKGHATDNECLLTGGVVALFGAAAISAFALMFFKVWPTVVILFFVVLVLGFGAVVFMCKTRAVAYGADEVRAVDIARAEMGLAEAATKDAATEEPAPGAPKDEGAKPTLLSAPRAGQADDLKALKGIGPKLEKELHEAGVFHYDQIAGWDAGQVAWADEHLVSFKGRVSRDDWVGQAKDLLEKGKT